MSLKIMTMFWFTSGYVGLRRVTSLWRATGCFLKIYLRLFAHIFFFSE